MPSVDRKLPASIWFVVAGFAAAYRAVAVLQHWHFNSSYDLAIYDQAVWHLSRLEAPASSFRGMSNLFGDHFHPVIALFAPLFWVAPAAETLLAAQGVLLAISIVPVFLYARDRLPRHSAMAISVLLVPFGLERFLSSNQNHWGTIFHYSAPLAPIAAMAAADGLARVTARIGDAPTRRRTMGTLAGVCVLLAAFLPGHQPLWRLFSPAFHRFGAVERAGYDAIGLIPADASVVAQANVAPHLSHRSALYRLDPQAPDADYVIAVDGRSPWPLADFAEIRNLLQKRVGYRVVFERAGWILLQRAATVDPQNRAKGR